MRTKPSIYACVLACALACCLGMGGCPQPPAPLPDIGGVSDFVGADVCRSCHRAVHAAWSASRHARALETLRSGAAETNAQCLGCHTTGYRMGGFVSAFATPKFGGVQCESCHGPGAKHVGSRNPADIVAIPLTDVCARCHVGPAQPNHEEWADSGHARAVDSLRADPAAADACLTCHSHDFAIAEARNIARALRNFPQLPLPSIEDADPANDPREGVGCGACHAPHGSAQPAQLRSTRTETCVACHNDPAPTPGRIPHAPQWNLLSGTGGQRLSVVFGTPTEPLRGAPSAHANVEDLGGCGKCHGLKARFDPPTAQTPNQTGHRFEVVFEQCTPCHTAETARSAMVARQAEFSARIADLRQQAGVIRQRPFLVAPDIARIDAALHNLALIEEDRSGGVHNTPYTRQLLDASQQLLNAIPP